MKKIFSLLAVLAILSLLGWFFVHRGSSPQILLQPEDNSQPAPVNPPSPEKKQELGPSLPESKSVLYAVPFTSQAPRAEWGKALFQNACEEASVVIAAAWAHGETLIVREVAEKRIVDMSNWETKKIGHSIDTDAADTQKLLLEDYSRIEGSELVSDFTLLDLQVALQKGIVIVPTNGQKLGNPNFKYPGPLTHMLVVIGYDKEKKEFITHDPGTRKGAGYRYNESILYNAIRDYPTGKHLPIVGTRKAMIIVPQP